MSSKARGNTKQVPFANNVKGAPAKHPSDMTAFERIAYVQTLDFEKEEQKVIQTVDEDYEDGKLTKEVVKRFISVHFMHLQYRLRLDPDRKSYDQEQTSGLKEEVTSLHPDLMRVVQCLERGANCRQQDSLLC